MFEKKSLLKFYTPSCGPCKTLSTKLTIMLPQFPQYELLELDASDPENKVLCELYDVKAVPTLVVLDGSNKRTLTGYTSSTELEAFLEG